jgi:adenylate cyclase
MTTRKARRKLNAILSADVKGYSRLMREDEEATVDTLKTYREAMSSLIQKFRGRIVDSPGDNVLAEFASVVDAVECPVEVQKELKSKNADLPENRRMEFRVGVNLGTLLRMERGFTVMESALLPGSRVLPRGEVSASRALLTSMSRTSCR